MKKKLLIVVAFLYSIPAFCQTNVGELHLKVSDPSGLGVESSVRLICEVNQFSDVYLTDAEGELEAKLLPFGVYQFRVERRGFATFLGSVTNAISRTVIESP
jgi:hypothetical protein